MLNVLIRFAVAFLPVVLFLGALIYLDSYKLVRPRRVLLTIFIGGLMALLAFVLNRQLMPSLSLEGHNYSRYVAPLLEETLKALVLVYLLRRGRIGFLVDAAIFGFAVGTGFAIVENAYYMQQMPDAHVVVWILRGFGTAVMHGGATAIVGIIAKSLDESRSRTTVLHVLPGLSIGVIVHSAFNHLLFSPVVSAIGILLALPPLVFVVFQRSEQSLRDWLDVGFDADTELLGLIHSGTLSDSPVGRFLHSLKSKFRGEVVADMLCYLRLHVELSLRAKGVLMMREAGFAVAPDDDTRAKFREMSYLEGSIGRTGRLAMLPFLHVSGKELWQLYMLPEK